MQSRYRRYAILFAVYVSLSSPAYAYLDGATASIILQAVIGAVTTWLVYSRMLASRARTFMARLFGKPGGDPKAK